MILTLCTWHCCISYRCSHYYSTLCLPSSSLLHRAVPAVGVLTLFYDGIFTLSLMFLDPCDNDKKHERHAESTGFDVGVLIREANVDSERWGGSAAVKP